MCTTDIPQHLVKLSKCTRRNDVKRKFSTIFSSEWPLDAQLSAFSAVKATGLYEHPYALFLELAKKNPLYLPQILSLVRETINEANTSKNAEITCQLLQYAAQTYPVLVYHTVIKWTTMPEDVGIPIHLFIHALLYGSCEDLDTVSRRYFIYVDDFFKKTNITLSDILRALTKLEHTTPSQSFWSTCTMLAQPNSVTEFIDYTTILINQKATVLPTWCNSMLPKIAFLQDYTMYELAHLLQLPCFSEAQIKLLLDKHLRNLIFRLSCLPCDAKYLDIVLRTHHQTRTVLSPSTLDILIISRNLRWGWNTQHNFLLVDCMVDSKVFRSDTLSQIYLPFLQHILDGTFKVWYRLVVRLGDTIHECYEHFIVDTFWETIPYLQLDEINEGIKICINKVPNAVIYKNWKNVPPQLCLDDKEIDTLWFALTTNKPDNKLLWSLVSQNIVYKRQSMYNNPLELSLPRL